MIQLRAISTLVSAGFIVIAALLAGNLWLDYSQAWLHPEQFATSAYIWNFPNQESFGDRLRKALDWKAFDPNVSRVRPLNDLADTIDAIARPSLAQLFEPHPSITPVAMVTAIATPALLFRYLRLAGFQNILVAALLAVFISSVGFLSVIIPAIHPAKKLTFLFLALSLYFGQRHERTGSTSAFFATICSIFLGLFADEMGLATYVFAATLIPSLLIRTTPWKRAVYLLLPVSFIFTVWWVLPTIYAKFSVHGPWNALSDAKKFELASYLVEPNFYLVSLVHIATIILTTLGVGLHTALTEGAAIVLFASVTIFLARPSRGITRDRARMGLVASALTLVAGGIYTTLLDWYPFPEAVSYLGAFTFYYHSSLNVLVILWLAFAWQRVFELAPSRIPSWQPAVVIAGTLLCAGLTVANFQLFANINRVVELLHTYPYSSASIHNQIRASLPEIRAARPDQVVTVRFERDPAQVDRDFETAARAVFGADWQNNDFYWTFSALHSNPIMKDDHPAALLHAYFPYVNFKVEVYSPTGELVAGSLPAGMPLVESPSGPPAPTNLAVTRQPGGDVLVTWDAVPTAIEIHVERRDGADADFREVGVTGQGSTGHLNTGLSPGVTYTWRMRGCSVGGCSPYSAEIDATSVP
jgi:hypothetical protein